MNINEMKKHEWVVSWSGGKDSTATIILMHKYKIPIKEIIYVELMFDNEIPATLPLMYEFVHNASKIFNSWGYKVSFVTPQTTATDIATKKYKKSKHTEKNGNYYGITQFVRGFCKFQGVKQSAVEKILNSNDFQMIGYAKDEKERLHRLSKNKQSILVELGITENETFTICRDYNLLSPIYELGLNRDGCWFCPNASKKERELLRSNYPLLVEKINNLITMCNYDVSYLSNRNNWVKDYFKKL